MGKPTSWSKTGLPCYTSGSAPSFLWTEGQLREHGLRPAGDICAYVGSKYGDAALYLITESALADPRSWPPIRPSDDERVESPAS